MKATGSIIRRMAIIIGLILGLAALFIALRLLMLRQDVASFKHYWEERQAIQPADGALWYIALGDSTAQGLGASGPEKGYAGLLASRLEKKTGRKVHVINLSVTGAKVRDVTERQLPRLRRLNLPDAAVVTLSVGANDMGGFEPEMFKRQTDELLASLPPQTVVADIAYFGGGRKRPLEPKVKAANHIIMELTEKHKLRRAQLHAITKARDEWTVYSIDLLHPSDKGYRNWADAFWEVLE